jgi:FkbM family methyltransferase
MLRCGFVTDRPEHLAISWAQHWEDVRLWRVFRHRPPGFYVDVGAMDPVIDSVTKVFYDHGWHGINIEPHPAYAAALRSVRTRDVVEETAADDAKGSVPLHLIATGDGDDTGLSTTVERHARLHATDGMSIRTIDVRTAPLTELLAGTDAEDPTGFHFLKIDVEGREAAVLRGIDLDRFRPIVVVLEAREPNRPTDAYGTAEDLLLRSAYRFSTDDGINRWYAREDATEVVDILAPQINPVTDGSPRRWADVVREDELRAEVVRLEARIGDLEGEASAMHASSRRAQDELERVAEELRSVQRSRSWRLTAPLRAVLRGLRGLRGPRGRA